MSCDEESRTAFVSQLATDRDWTEDETMAFVRATSVVYQQGVKQWNEGMTPDQQQWMTSMDGVATHMMDVVGTPRRTHKGREQLPSEMAGYMALLNYLTERGMFTPEQTSEAIARYRGKVQASPPEESLPIYRDMATAKAALITNETGKTLSDDQKGELRRPRTADGQSKVETWQPTPQDTLPDLDDAFIDQLEPYADWGNVFDVAHDLQLDKPLRFYDRPNETWRKGADGEAKQDIDATLREDSRVRVLSLFDTYTNDRKRGGEGSFREWLEKPQTLYRSGRPSDTFISVSQSASIAQAGGDQSGLLYQIDIAPRRWLGTGLSGGTEIYLANESVAY